MWTLGRCEAEPAARGGADGGGESASHGGGTPRARVPEREDNAENGSGNGNRNDGLVGARRGTLVDESETADGAVD